MSDASTILRNLYMAVLGLFLAMPIVVVCGAALNGGRSMFFPPQEPTLQRFVDFFVSEPVWLGALQTSLVISVGSATLATLIAWPVAYALWIRQSPLSKGMFGLAGLPFLLPPIVFGVGLSFLWAFLGELGHVWSGLVSHTALFLALPLVTISIGLNAIDRAHLDAAATMGADSGTRIRTIILPQVAPYAISGFFFAMVLSFNEFIVMFFVSSSAYTTVTLQIFNSLRNGFTPTMAVGAILFIFTSILVFGLVGWWGNLPQLLGADTAKGDK